MKPTCPPLSRQNSNHQSPRSMLGSSITTAEIPRSRPLISEEKWVEGSSFQPRSFLLSVKLVLRYSSLPRRVCALSLFGWTCGWYKSRSFAVQWRPVDVKLLDLQTSPHRSRESSPFLLAVHHPMWVFNSILERLKLTDPLHILPTKFETLFVRPASPLCPTRPSSNTSSHARPSHV